MDMDGEYWQEAIKACATVSGDELSDQLDMMKRHMEYMWDMRDVCPSMMVDYIPVDAVGVTDNPPRGKSLFVLKSDWADEDDYTDAMMKAIKMLATNRMYPVSAVVGGVRDHCDQQIIVVGRTTITRMQFGCHSHIQTVCGKVQMSAWSKLYTYPWFNLLERVFDSYAAALKKEFGQ